MKPIATLHATGTLQIQLIPQGYVEVQTGTLPILHGEPEVNIEVRDQYENSVGKVYIANYEDGSATILTKYDGTYWVATYHHGIGVDTAEGSILNIA
jgi:hypothetical protein